MTRDDLTAVERLVWRRVLKVSRAVEGLRVTHRRGMPEDIFDVEVPRDGRGCLEWVVQEGYLDGLDNIAVGLPQGDRIALALSFKDRRLEPVALQMIAQSNWSRVWYPMSQMEVWPDDVLLAKEEVASVIRTESDFYSILAYDKAHRQYRVLAFRHDEQPFDRVVELARKMVKGAFQASFFHPKSLKERHKYPRLDKDEPLDRGTKKGLLLVPYVYSVARALPRSGSRLYEHHWVHHLVNPGNPIPYLRHTKTN